MILAFVGSNPATPARYDSLAQPVERRTFNAMVRGSNPRWVTIKEDALASSFGYSSGMKTPQGFGGCLQTLAETYSRCKDRTYAATGTIQLPSLNRIHPVGHQKERTCSSLFCPVGDENTAGVRRRHSRRLRKRETRATAERALRRRQYSCRPLTAYTRWVTKKRGLIPLFFVPSGMRTPP